MPGTMLGSEKTDDSIPALVLIEHEYRQGDAMKTRSTRGQGAVADAVREESEKCVCVLGKCHALEIPWSTKLTSFPPF